VEFQKARVRERIAKEKARKKRTRALILWATGLIRELSPDEIRTLIKRTRKHLIAREGKKEVDYLQFLVEEIKNVRPELVVNPKQ